jgi:hypothetical protein
MKFEEQIAQCTGLWLAEGDSVSKSEITLTNNNPELILLFHKTLTKLFNPKNPPRVYVYSPSVKMKPTLPLDIIHKHYVDGRANKSYYIYRVADVNIVNQWQSMTLNITQNVHFFKNILQGFFAGEGNIKFIKKSKSRIIRISQGQINPLLEKILNYFQIDFIYSPKERAYIISKRENLERLVKIDIGILHKIKNKKLIEMIETYKQYHYPKNHLKKELLKILNKPFTSKQLSHLFKRSQSRITRVLVSLNKENKIKKFRINSVTYWVNINQNIIIISKRKQQILQLLNKSQKTSDISKILKITWKSTFKRLKELERLNLVKNSNNLWYKVKTNKEVIVF